MDGEPTRGGSRRVPEPAPEGTRMGVRRTAAPAPAVEPTPVARYGPGVPPPPAAPPPAATPPPAGTPPPAAAAPVERTRLGRRRQAPPAAAVPSAAAVPVVAPAPSHGDGLVRFGPGVPVGPPPGVPAWTAAAAAPPPRRRRRWSGWLLTLLIVGGVIAYLLTRQDDSLAVSAASVAPAADPGTSCDITVDVVGTITTNGDEGTIRYQWLRSDGEQSEILSQSAAEDGRPTQVHLQWTFSGRGTYEATATLLVLEPDPLEAVGAFTYRCP